jgi:hypothetical protein
MKMGIHGYRHGTEHAFHVNGINKISHGYPKAANIFHGYLCSIVTEFSVHLWSVNQWTTEAEEVTDL